MVENSKTATVTRLTKPERELSDGMGMDDVMRLFTGQLNTDDYYTSEVIEFESAWGSQHAGVLENFAANILDGTPLIAPGSDGINGVRLANAIHLSSWTGQEVPLDFDEDAYLSELNQRIRDEGTVRGEVKPTPWTLRGDLAVSYADGRTEVIAERKAPSGGGAYWGVSHEVLIRDFYARFGDDEPFWISPWEAEKSLRSCRTSIPQCH